jgi:co-chaperonin GroES (HSP10)
MTQKFKPLGDKLTLRPVETTPAAGTIILLESQSPYNTGVVVAISSTLDTPLETGQSVLYEKHAGTPFTEGGETLLIISEQHIVGIQS